MNLPFQIKTIDEFKETTIVEKKSTFIARVYSAESENKVKEHLNEIKKKYYDASHHCYAYRFSDGHFRYSDAGEPSGTAGVRILNAIDHFKLTNQLVIITRFFGGVKLGVGLLGKAYYLAAYKVLNESNIITKQLFQKVIITSKFEHVDIVHRILSKYNSIILSTEYQDDIKFSCLVRLNEMDSITKKLAKLAKNEIIFTPYKEFVYK
ncbi:MAG: YigZ family protein [Ignavibacteriaceae bacterium]|jgi:uncharacterized YigZ family protein|nr:YigZ family protein [Ignavibacteriaceae bacterium]MCW8812901.1 YigZ family protein [Chlorobium sp.]MCW8818465.1 YigZ family protein [Ignavibacteriaceae bacterium]MCW8824334.1 YigZ family protein [Ignavibacteriaceae bacterium]MCW8961076.1 YigZ family protein [Ignavibacteriaceae bacterium]